MSFVLRIWSCWIYSPDRTPWWDYIQGVACLSERIWKMDFKISLDESLHREPLILLAQRQCLQLKKESMQIQYLWLYPNDWHRSTAIIFIIIKQIHFLYLIGCVFFLITAKARYFLNSPLCSLFPEIFFNKLKKVNQSCSDFSLITWFSFPFSCWEQNWKKRYLCCY